MNKIARLLVISILLLAAGCQKESRPVTDDRLTLDTLVSVSAYDDGRGEPRVRKILNEAFRGAAAMEKELDARRSGSGVRRLNLLARGDQASGAVTIPVSDDLWAALKTEQIVYRQTGGAYDPTIGPVTRLWGFGEKERVPDFRALQRAAALVNGRNLILDAGPPKKAGLAGQGTNLDLGGIAKGAAVDRIADTLSRRGLNHSLINAVSSVTALGPKPDGEPWRVGVQSPRPKTTPGMIAVIKLSRGHISTSGDYQRTFTADGKRYHHIIDPGTGRPAAGFMSVTVVTDKSAAYADALSTGLAVMGRKKALRLVERLPGTDAFFVDRSGRFWTSSGLVKRLVKLTPKVE